MYNTKHFANKNIFIEKGAKEPRFIFENIQEMWFRKKTFSKINLLAACQ